MTIEAAQGGDPEPGPATCGQRRARWDQLAAEYAALMEDVAADRDRPDLARRMAALTVALREDRAEIAGHVFTDALTTARAAATAAPGRHRAEPAPAPAAGAKVYRFRPRPAHGLAPAAVLLAGHGTRHVLTAHLKTLTLTAATAGVAAGAVTYTMQTTPDRQPLAPAASAPAVVPSAVALPATAGPRIMRKHHRPARLRVYPVTAPAATSPPATPPPPPSSPGVLDIQTPAVTLQQTTPGAYTGQLVLYATGGQVRWKIDVLGTSSVLRFSQPFGTIADGQPVTVTITVDAASALSGPWTVTLGDGQQVTVTAAG